MKPAMSNFFFETLIYINKQASRLIKNLSALLGILVRKRVRKKTYRPSSEYGYIISNYRNKEIRRILMPNY
jgi:hypothetical protein